MSGSPAIQERSASPLVWRSDHVRNAGSEVHRLMFDRRGPRWRGVLHVVACVVATGCPRLVKAQTSAPPVPFVMQSRDGDNLIQVGVLFQLDGRFAVNDTADTFTDT